MNWRSEFVKQRQNTWSDTHNLDFLLQQNTQQNETGKGNRGHQICRENIKERGGANKAKEWHVWAGELINEMSHSAIFFGLVGYFKCKCCWEISSRCYMLNSRGQNCQQLVSSLDLSYYKLMKHGSGCGGGGSALHPLLVCREAPQEQQANEGLISLWTASRSRGWSPWHRHVEQDKQTPCPHYILY